MATKISSGVAHTVPKDLKEIFTTSTPLLAAWESLTPLARNEWICWTISVKKAETRSDHLRRLKEELLNGKRRPCCWPGCPHRTKP